MSDDKKMTAEMLRQEIEKLKPMAELGRMSATVAHEIRNPLTGISAHAELLRDVLTDPLDIESINMIMSEVDRLANLVSDLLHYSRERDAKKDHMNLGIIANKAIELLKPMAEQEGVSLVSAGNGLAIGDQELLNQALLNIIRNAIQACKTGGTVSLDIEDNAIKIIDEGEGVPEGIKETIFEPFVTGRTKGLGLGAAVAKRCMNRQSANIEIIKSDKDGSIFKLSY